MAKRASATWTIDVARKPQEVFDYLADVRRHHEWSPKPYRIEGLADGPVRLGSTFTSYGWVPRDADHRNEVEVTTFETPTRLGFTSREQGQETYNTYTLTASATGTRVVRTMDMPTPDGLTGMIFPMFLGGFIKPKVMSGMQMCKANLESAAS